MPVEDGRNIFLRRFLPADFLSLSFGILHTGSDPCAEHGKFQFGEYCTHLNECLAHGIDIPVAAVDGNAAEDDQAQVFLLDDVHNFAELLRTAGESADFKRDDGIQQFNCLS